MTMHVDPSKLTNAERDLRNDFAKSAMVAIISKLPVYTESSAPIYDVALGAFEYADAMMYVKDIKFE